MKTAIGGRPPFRMEEHFGQGQELRLALIGELDLAVTHELGDRLRELRKGGYLVRIDLSGLDFIDSTGLQELIAAVSDSRQDGGMLSVDPKLTDPVRRVIDLVGAQSFFWPNRD